MEDRLSLKMTYCVEDRGEALVPPVLDGETFLIKGLNEDLVSDLDQNSTRYRISVSRSRVPEPQGA
jgi:hypothetical protein